MAQHGLKVGLTKTTHTHIDQQTTQTLTHRTTMFYQRVEATPYCVPTTERVVNTMHNSAHRNAPSSLPSLPLTASPSTA